jgi:hypothetical protein
MDGRLQVPAHLLRFSLVLHRRALGDFVDASCIFAQRIFSTSCMVTASLRFSSLSD